ncbi:hypothetical protein C8Q79DRAFT_1005984 [Trametes meyenii]|nr:hypothetical protein C8Q79DRAFT_1005984 [Trametes meyenii]
MPHLPARFASAPVINCNIPDFTCSIDFPPGGSTTASQPPQTTISQSGIPNPSSGTSLIFSPALTPTTSPTSPSETVSASNPDGASSPADSLLPADPSSSTAVVSSQAAAATQSSEITRGGIGSVWSTPMFDQTTAEASTTVVSMLSTITVSDGAESTTLTSTSSTSTSIATTTGEEENSKRTGGPSPNTAEIVAICIACLLFLILCVSVCLLRRRRRSTTLFPLEDIESTGPYNIGDGDGIALVDYKNHSHLDHPSPLGPTASETNPRSNDLQGRDDAEKPDEQSHDENVSTSQSTRSSSTLSYINSLCPEMAPLFPDPPITLPTPLPPAVPAPRVPRPQFRPLPMPFPLASLDRASVWSVMDANSTRETVHSPDLAYGDVFAFYHASSRNGSEVDIERPPEYSRY